MKQYKKYKESAPEQTIRNIQSILSGIGVLLKDQHRETNGMYSCRVIIGNRNLDKLDIGTNGKGISFEYSMASGYAEFMERIQNRILFSDHRLAYSTDSFIKTLPQNSLYVQKLKQNNSSLDFMYDPKEEIWSIDKIIEHWGKELMKLYNIEDESYLHTFFIDKLQINESLMIPSYSVSENKEILIPVRLILYATGSNGMAAGNTEEEAILQSICEIFERYAASEIYYNQLTPPTVPLETFKGTNAYEKINYIKQKTGYEIIVKDCSLGKGIPVIGVIFTDKQNLLYNFKLGSDFVPHIALERCVTEAYQGQHFRGLPLKFCWEGDILSDVAIDINFNKIIKNSTGFWHRSILHTASSYKFTGFNPELGLSNQKDIQYSMELIQKMGYNVYIRNNSILGFPAYYIIIPGISQTTKYHRRYELFHTYDFRALSNMKHIGKITKHETLALANAIEHVTNVGMHEKTSNYLCDYVLYNDDEDIQNIDENLLLFKLFYFSNQYDKAKQHLDEFLLDKNETYSYYFAISDYVYLKHVKNYSCSEIENILGRMYGDNIANEVMADVSDPDKIFQYHEFPVCFDCEVCKVSKTCRFFDVVHIQKKINDVAKNSYIKQSDTGNLFNE
ncbi:MAG: YcaO-like family protein [Prevotellaceae bacterium]|jgi:ribosomal protein S12 methylthiotransferase accessory factor|nr:YcaO-like family protein [Prevotellaceae bacterium]